MRRGDAGMLPEYKGAKALWVSSTGGHLAELNLIARSIEASPDSVWVTARTAQSESLLANRRTFFVDYVSPRDLRGAFRAGRRAEELLARESFDVCISTGAALA